MRWPIIYLVVSIFLLCVYGGTTLLVLLFGAQPYLTLISTVAGVAIAYAAQKQFKGREEESKKQILWIATSCLLAAIIFMFGPALIITSR